MSKIRKICQAEVSYHKGSSSKMTEFMASFTNFKFGLFQNSNQSLKRPTMLMQGQCGF